jgi:hypothetical protein
MIQDQRTHIEYGSPVVAGGYILVVPFTAPEYLANPRLPRQLITASWDLTAIGPGPWALSWVNQHDSDRQQRIAFGIDEASLPEVSVWVEEKMRTGEWGWPRIFTGLQPAREFLVRFHPSSEPTIVGMGMAAESVDEVLADHPDVPGMGMYGYVETLRRRQPLAPGGLELGYELLGEELGGVFHSWHCNNLEPVVHEKLGIEVNQYGLIGDLEAARRAAEFVARPDMGAEPVTWRPWLLVTYAAAEAANMAT